MRLPAHQLAQSGATDGQGLVWSDSLNMWVPATLGGIQSIVEGTNITVDDTDPANPIVSATGGGGGVAVYPLDPTSLHATYGDHFTGASLDAKWTRVGYVSGDEQYQKGGGSFLQIDNARAAGNYYYQAAPSGDFTILMSGIWLAQTNVMPSLLIFNNSGNGVNGGFYSGPDASIVGICAAGAYNSTSFAAVNAPTINAAGAGVRIWQKLEKSGTAYRTSLSLNGIVWRKWTATITSAITPTRIGFGSAFGTPQSLAIDWFDVQ